MMIEKKKEADETYLSIQAGPGETRETLIDDFARALETGCPVEAPAWLHREFGITEQREDVGTIQEIIAAANDPAG